MVMARALLYFARIHQKSGFTMSSFSSFRKLALALTCAVGLMAGSAQALTITSTSDDFTTVFSQAGPGGSTLSASVLWDIQSVSATTITILVSIHNTTTLGTLVNAGISSFGLETAPVVAGSISGGAHFIGVSNGSIPS